jgi:hypothetical protein
MLVLAIGAGTGCFSLPHLWEGSKPPAAAARTPPPSPEVVPEQVDDANARQMADQLQQEVDQDNQPRTTADTSRLK